MKKFMIFLLMTFLYVGTCHARSETSHLNNAYPSLHRWVSPTPQSFLMARFSPAPDIVVSISPSQPQSVALNGSANQITYGVSITPAVPVTYQWLVDGTPISGSNTTTFTTPVLPVGTHTVVCQVIRTGDNAVFNSAPVHLTVAEDIVVNVVGLDNACQNDVVTLTAVVENDQIGHNYQWRLNGNYIIGATGPSYSFVVDSLPNLTENLVYEFDVEITRNGCESYHSPIHYFYVMPTPVVTLTATPGCLPDSATLTASAHTSTDVQPYQWIWRNGTDSSAIQTTFENTIQLPDGKYLVQAVYQNSACNAYSDIVTVTSIDPASVSTQPIALNASADTVCLGARVDFSIQDGNTALGDATYTWYVDGQNVGNHPCVPCGDALYDSTYFTTFTVGGIHTVTVAASYSDYPCEILYSKTDTIFVTNTVGDAPVLATVEPVCEGGQYTVSIQNPVAGDVYTWYENGVVIPGENLSSLSLNRPAGTYNYAASIVNMDGCSSALSDAITVNVLANPTVAISGDAWYCNGNTINLTANVNDDNGHVGHYTYAWRESNATIAGANSATLQVTNAAAKDEPYVYTAIVTDATHGCVAESAPYYVYVGADITVAVTVNDNKVCTGNEVTATAHLGDYTLPGITYQWYKNGTAVNYGTSADFTTTITSNTELKVVVRQDATGCTAEGKDSVRIYGTPSSVNDITLNASADTVCLGSRVDFEIVDNNTTLGTPVYNWYVDGQNVGVHPCVPCGDAIMDSTYFTVFDVEGIHTVTVAATYSDYPCDVFYSKTDTIVVSDVVGKAPKIAVESMICEGNQFTVSDTANVGGFYTWYENGIEIPGENLSSITLSRPAGTYRYAASVIVSEACKSKLSKEESITVIASPSVSVSGDAWYCHNNTVELHANVNDDNGHVGHYTYQWRESNANISGQTSATLSKSYAAQDEPYVFTVVVTDPTHGCVVESAPYYVYVGADINVAVTIDPDTICAGGEVTATAHLGDYTLSGITYQWFKNNVAVDYGTSAQFTTNIDTKSELKVVVTQDATGCTAVGKDTVYTIGASIFSIVAINGTNPLVAPNNVVCQGAQIFVAASLKDEVGNPVDSSLFNYVWKENGITMPNVTGASFSKQIMIEDDDQTQFVYTAYLDLGTGCMLNAVASDTIIVKRNPIVEISGVHNVCYNGNTDLNVHLTAWVDGRTDNDATYKWYKNGALTNNINTFGNLYNENLLPTYNESYIFEVEVINGDGCSTISAPFEVYVHDAPVVNITGDANEICEGGNVVLNANLDNYNDEMLTFQWYKNQRNTANLLYGYTHETEMFEPATTTNYIVEVVHLLNDNTSEYFNCTALDTFRVVVNPIPVVTDVTVDLETVCNGAMINLSATINPTDAEGAVYTWYRNGQVIEGATQATYSENVFTSDNQITVNTYRAAVTLPASGCQSEVSADAAVVTVKPAPATVAITGNNIICEGDVTTLTAYSDVPGTFTWSTGENTTSINVPAGVYTVRLTTPEGCEMTSAPFTVEALGTELLATATETAICQYEHTTLMVGQDGWAGNVTYQWSANAGNSTNTTVDVQPMTTTTYVVTATVNSTNGTCTAVDSVTIQVSPRPAQVVVTATTRDTICEGQQISFHADGSQYDYRWYLNGIQIEGENQADITLNFFNYGDYTIAAKAVNDQGCESYTFSAPVVVRVNPAPSVVTISGNNTICENDRSTLTAYSDVPGTFTWSTGEHTTSIDVPAGEYFVTIRTAEGCELTSERFAVEALGTELLATATETAICQYEHTTLMVGQDGWAGNVTYEWSANAGGSRNTTVDVQPMVTTTYVVTATVNSTNGTCTAVDSVTIQVSPRPAQVVVTATSRDTICEGQQISFHADGDQYDYRWYLNGIQIEGEHESDIILNFFNYGDYTIAAKAVNDQGCESYTFSAPVVVRVNPAPSVVTISGNNIICENDRSTLTAYSDVPGTFTWSTGEHTTSIDVPAGEYFVTIRTAEGCEMTSERFAVEALGTELLATATETAICQYEHTTLMVGQDGWAGNVTYQWSANAGNSTNTTVDVQPMTTTTYVVTATVNSTNGTCTAVDSVTIQVSPRPDEVVLDIETVTICEGEQVTFNADGDQYSYRWYLNGVQIEGEDQASLTLNFYNEGIYNVAAKAVNDQGCESYTFSAPAVVTVHAAPESVVVSGQTVICDGGQTTLYANVTPLPTASDVVVYTWYKDNVLIPGASESSYVVTEPGSYKSEVFTNGCATVSAAVVVTVEETPRLQLTATEMTICAGGTSVIAAEPTGWNNNDVNYTWDNGFEGSVYTFNSTVAGDFTFNVTASQATSGCVASDVITIHVNEIPVINSVTVNDYNVCEGAQLTVTANLEGPSQTDDVYTWYRNGVVIPGATARVINDSPVTVDNNTQQFVYTAVVTRTPSGCTSLPVSAAAVTVYPNPTVVISGDQHVCETDSVFLIANVDTIGANVGLLHYTWYESGQIRDNMAYGLGDNQFFAEYFYARVEPYRFVVEVQREGVPAACASRSQEFNVYVYPRPVVNITASETEICEDGQVTLTANLNDYNFSNMIYQWYEIGSHEEIIAVGYENDDYIHGQIIYDTITVVDYLDIPGATSPVYTTNLNETVTLGVRVIHTLSTCFDTDEIEIIVNPRPVVTNVTVNGLASDVVCNGAQVDLAATIAPEDAEGAIYTWYRDGQMIEGATQATYSENVYTLANQVTTHTYTVSVVLPASGCESAMSTMAAVVTVKPGPSVVSITGNHIICENDVTTLTAYSDVEGELTWSTGSHDASITVPAGVYTVTMRTAEGCEMTSEPFAVEAYGTQMFVTANRTSICAGEHTTLYVTQDGWVGNVTFAWDENAGNSTANTVDVTPATTTTYHVTATVNSTTGTCSVEDEVTIVVTPLPATVEVTATTPTTVCEGEQVTFSADGDAAGYIWYNNGIVIEGHNQAIITLNFDNEGQYAISAKAVNEEGCVSAEASEPVVVTVNAAPESVVITGATTICDGGSTTLYANVTPNVTASTVVTYTWFKDNVVLEGETNASLVVTETGSYKVEVSTNGCSTVSDAVVVTIQQAPRLQLTATETTICVGGNTVISAEATGWNNEDVIYTWSNGFVGTAYTFVPTTAGDYTFAVTASQSTSGCVATDEITIHVNEVPAAPQISLNNAQICDGGQVTLTIENDYTSYGNATYQWYRNGQLIDGAVQAVYTESPLAVDNDLTTYSYNAVVSFNASGCVSSISENSIVTVIPTPAVAIAFNGNTTVCAGGEVSMTANVTPANAAYNYQWYKDNVLMEGETSNTLIDNPAVRETGYNYSVEVSAAPGCVVRAEAPAAVNVVADPIVTVTVDNAILCQGGSTTFRAIVEDGVNNANGLGRYTYAWYNTMSPDAAIGTGATYTTTGTEEVGNYEYWVVVSSIYGCETQSENVHYSVVADPQVVISVAPGADAMVCDGGHTTLMATVTGGYGTASYQWYKNGLPLYGQTNMTLVTDAIVYGQTANNTYSVVVSQTGVNCEAVADDYTVAVAPRYEVSISGNANVCVGGQVTLNATVANMIANDPVSYQWFMMHDGIETPINGANAANYTTSNTLLPGSYEYFVVVSSNISGCSYTAASSVDANVVADPTVRIEAAGNNVVVCENGEIHLNAVVSNGVAGAAYTYTWTWFGAATGSATTATPNYTVTLPANDPANPYFFQVTINRNDNTGCEATSEAVELNFVAAPAVTVTANRSVVCAGGEVTFTANVAAGSGYDYDYAWTINGVAQSVNASSITTTLNNVGTINATVTVSRPGTTACSTTQSISVPVNVVADPVVTIAADHLTMCAGGTTTLSVANLTVDSQIPANYSYQWALNGFEVEGAINETFVQPLNAAGTYVYTLRVTQNDGLGCASVWSAPVTVQVAEQPVVELNSDYGLNICEGGQISLTGTVTNFGNTVNGVLNNSIYGNMTYNWMSQGNTVHTNNSTSAQNQITETLNTVGNYSYQVVVAASGYACQPVASNVVTVGVVSDPSWTDVHVYYPDVCIGQDVLLEAGIQGGVVDAAGSTNGHIQWTVEYNGVTSNVSGGFGGNSFDTPAAAGTYIYTPTWVGNIGNGCAFTNTASVQTTVEVHALPTAAFTNGDGSIICANVYDASAELTITFTGTAPFTFQLENLGTGELSPVYVSGTNTFTVNLAPESTTQYRIIMVADAYCQNALMTEANTVATVFVNAIEFAESMFVSGCDDNGNVTINFNMISGAGNADFTVMYENGEVYNGTISGGNTATFPAPAAPGDYNATFTVEGCTYDIVVRVLVGEYSFNPEYPIMAQRWHDVAVVNCNPELNGGHTFVSFQWYKNGVAIPGATFSNYQEFGGLNGFYSVELFEQREDGTMVSYTTCDMYFASAGQIKVYPVPANVNQEVTIEIDLTDEELEGATLDIFDVTGQLVQQINTVLPITKVSGFHAQGTYFGRILTGTNEIKTVKFIIVK